MTEFPPGPRAHPVVQTAIYARDPVTALETWHARHGDLFTIRIAGVGPLVFAAAPAEVRQIFTADPAHLSAGAAGDQLVPIVGTQSVLTLDGAQHQRHRRMMLPPFHGDRMATYAGIVRDATRRAMAGWPRGAPFALHPQMLHVALEVLLRAVFGVTEARELAEFGALFDALIGRWSSPVWPMLAMLGVDPIKWAPWLPVARAKAALDRRLRAEIATRRARGGDGSDVFSLLLAARDDDGQPLSDGELRDELVTLLVAGHETSATALAWVFERLLVHPQVLATVRDELASVTHGGELDLAAVDKLPYLDAVVRETLRQRPILAFIARRAMVPFEIGGFHVPAGTLLCPAIHLAHRRAETWPEPEQFRPERFVGKKPNPYEWLPFGGGGRRCLGLAFAMFEIKAILATVLAETSLELDARRPLGRVLRGVTVVPEGGTRVRLTR